MTRALLFFVVLALHVLPLAQAPVARPPQADTVVRVLSDLETALATNRLDAFLATSGRSLTLTSRAVLDRALGDTRVTTATIRERARRPIGDGFEVLVDVFVSHERRGRIATWRLETRPSAGDPDRADLTSITEVAAVSDLLRLSLDRTKSFSVHDLTFTAPDLTLKMASGVAFVAESETGVTALVLHGKGQLLFTPGDQAEQGQLRLFGGKASLATDIDFAFIRVNSAEFADRISDRSLQPAVVAPGELSRAEEVFALQSRRSYNIDLLDLSSEQWSLEPAYGSLVVEFRSRRFGWLTYARSPGDAEDISLFDRGRRRNISVYASREKIAQRGPFYSDDDGAAYEVEQYALDIRFDPSRAWVAGRTTLRVKFKQTAVSLSFKLADSLVVSSVTSREYGRMLTLRVTGQNSFIVSLPQFASPGQTLTVDVAYAGRLEPQGLDREALAPEGVQQPNVPSGGFDAIQTPEPRFLYSNSSAWYPQPPSSGYARATLRLTVPSEYQVVASGTVTGTAVTPATDLPTRDEVRYVRTVTYATDEPVRYLACVISRFVPVGRSTTGAVNVEVVSTPRQTGRSRNLPARVAAVLRDYTARVGDAPYADFTLAALDDNLPGGHSPGYFAVLHQALPSTPYSWASDPVAFDNYPDFFLAHEVAHQWWGQAVGWKNYHDQWISEGFAQYFAVLFAESDRGVDAARSLLSQMRASTTGMSDQGPISLGYRLGHVQGDSRIFRGIVYNKSALVLHMLRRLMGDDAFFRAMRRFYAEFRFKKAGTEDFRRIFEAEATIKLDRFVERWILAAALPRLRVTSRIEADGRTVVVKVEQLGQVFDFPYTVAVEYADGSAEAVTLAIHDAVSEQRFALAGPVRRLDTKDELLMAEWTK